MTREIGLRSLNHPIDTTTPQGRLIFNLFDSLSEFERDDGIVSAACAARFAPLEELSDEDFRFSLANKLMGQVNLCAIESARWWMGW